MTENASPAPRVKVAPIAAHPATVALIFLSAALAVWFILTIATQADGSASFVEQLGRSEPQPVYKQF